MERARAWALIVLVVVVLSVVVVLPVGVVLAGEVPFETTPAAAAVVMPANASRSPQAKIERRKI